jgi:hypothetical protein
MNRTIELGLDTFGDVTEGTDGKPLQAAQVIYNLVNEAVLADEVGVDFIGVGERHSADFAVASPRWCSRRSPAAPSRSGSALRWRCSRRAIRSRCRGGLPPWMR